VNGPLVGSKAYFVLGSLPQILTVETSGREGPKKPVKGHVRGAVIGIKVHMMDHMVPVARAWPDEARMTNPSLQSAVVDHGQGNDWMDAKGDRTETGGVVDCRLNWMHTCPRKGCDIVTFVVQRMNVAVKEFANIRKPGYPPGVHQPVDGVEVSLLDVAVEQDPESTFVGRSC